MSNDSTTAATTTAAAITHSGSAGAGQEAQAMTEKPLGDRVDDLRFGIEKSIRYHHRRMAYYDLLHRAMMFGVIVAGSAAFSEQVGKPAWLGLLAAVFAAINLVWNLSHKARDHKELHRRFSDLLGQMNVTEPSEVMLGEWTRERIKIEADEPPIFWAVEADCYNEVAAAWGRKKGQLDVGWVRWLFMNFLRFETFEFKSRSPAAVK